MTRPTVRRLQVISRRLTESAIDNAQRGWWYDVMLSLRHWCECSRYSPSQARHGLNAVQHGRVAYCVFIALRGTDFRQKEATGKFLGVRQIRCIEDKDDDNHDHDECDCDGQCYNLGQNFETRHLPRSIFSFVAIKTFPLPSAQTLFQQTGELIMLTKRHRRRGW